MKGHYGPSEGRTLLSKEAGSDQDKMTVATLAASSPTPAVLRLVMQYIGRRLQLTPQQNVEFHKTQEFRDSAKHYTA